MISLKEVANLITITLLGALILFTLIDNVLIVVVKIRKPLLENEYYEFHKRHGFLKVTFLKLFVSLLIIYFLFEPVGKSGALGALVGAYGVFIIRLLIDFIKKKG